MRPAILQVFGILLIVASAWMVAPALGFFAAGVGAIAFGVADERSG
jgi:hypothetical protein